ncbi:flagellar motor protein MotB [Shewanella polaris]|uniref:OmpA-like domain-containing protein n=1 Tax=Shewanella polaris TaxID=2588449 RepID=A0A4Y5YCT2_9GAMM|nr:flagellar motor protein MotB [Shewanella polaris]QDE30306.1 hypothetical protein FH971_04560 [Shewanella polaris]
MLQKNEPIIIKRGRRSKRSASHGGAWKVAFADFTLAMMALFMVLWIMQIADQDERTQIVQYLRGEMYATGDMNPFDSSQSSSMIDFEGSPAIQEAIITGNATGPDSELGAIVPGQYDTQAQQVLLAKHINRVVQESKMADNIAVTLVPQGVRILIHDNIDRFMFTRGSAQMQSYFEDLLLALGPVLGQVTNAMMITGHTDSTPYAGSLFTNWELSSQRALLARRMLELGGVKRNQVIQVTGMADQVAYIPEDTAAAANRRIEVLILNSTTEEVIRSMVGIPAENLEGEIHLQDAKLQTQLDQTRARFQ